MAEVDLGALRKNVDLIAAALGPGVGLMAVVKADAYGHGAVPCARAIERKVWGFAVSLVEEGVELRRAGVAAPVVVLGSCYGLAHRDVVAYRLTPVLTEPSDLERFARAVQDLGLGHAGKLGLHLKIDSGMGRLGVRPETLGAFVDELRRYPTLELTGLCTHLADADGGDPEVTRLQLGCLEDARQKLHVAGFHPTVTHVANSAGTLRFVDARADLVRPGLALYGYSSGPRAAWVGLSPVLSLKSAVVSLREIPTGSKVSYGGLFVAARPTRVATVPIGYADGYSRRMSGQAQVLVGGKRCPVLGAITMDMCMVDVTDTTCQLGDEVVLFGAQGQARISVEELANWAGTIVWEICCGVSKRVPRSYLGELT